MLRGDRSINETEIKLTCESVAEAGVVLCYSTIGSGSAIGDSAGKSSLLTDPSGSFPAGLLLNDFVNIDETRYPRNRHKDEHKVGERCTLLRKGRVVTDKVTGTPTGTDVAYLTANGVLTPTKSATGGIVATPPVGRFTSKKDANGFVEVDVNLPQVY